MSITIKNEKEVRIMKKLLALAVFLVSPFAYAQHEHDAQSTQAPMMMPMMMMGDPEMQKMMMEHMQRCREQMMHMLMENPKFMHNMMSMMLKHRETMKKVLEANPQMKEQMKEMLK
jgi:hypothetical protein